MNWKKPEIATKPRKRRYMLKVAIPAVVLAALLLAIALPDSDSPQGPVPEEDTGPSRAEIEVAPTVLSQRQTPLTITAPEQAAVERHTFVLKTGQALVTALQQQGISAQQAGKVALALQPVYQARKLRAGQAFELAATKEGQKTRLQSLVFKTSPDRQVVIERSEDGFRAEERRVPRLRQIVARTLIVKGSLAGAAAAAEVPLEPVLEIEQQLRHKVDFKRRLKDGDTIDLTFERFVDPEEGVAHTGALLSARLRLGDRKAIEIYRYKTPDGIISFYDREGVSIETELARTPVVGGVLTSTYGLRDHPLLKIARMHKGMDYAAPKGSAVVVVRSGRVVRASRNGSFGNYVRIDHGDGIETAYAHLSKYREGLKKGDKVKQGDIIGYVGESGLATSPSLHYEVLRNGRQVNPRAIKLPPRIALKGEDLIAFRRLQQDLQAVFEQQDENATPRSG